MTTITTSRDKLCLPGHAAEVACSTPMERARKTASGGFQKRPAGNFDHAKAIREFHFLDGRAVSVHQHAVYWAVPLKDDPDNSTLVGVKGGEKPLPLRIAYPDFVLWWRAERGRKIKTPTPSESVGGNPKP
jgi:hypothetical protein